MNFKALEISGFKSFADKIDIKFGQGITCIVGPNGCGKSNVADAIKWVLGEQSAKSLRGGSMKDVIFNGTLNRKSLSFCEVSLIFDNTNRAFDIDYNELVFTRKLYRSGESEYLINRQPCRLKDIVRHFHSVGLGKDGYSVIEQNRVTEIINAKPLDRRAIFEEATGISGFRIKKNESERKLAAAAENLELYSGIMDEVGRRLAPLEKQAESARKYLTLAENLKSHEINTYLFKHENAEGERQKINLRLQSTNADAEDKKRTLAKHQKEYETAFTSQQTMDQTLFEMQEKLREMSVAVEKQQGEGKIYNERISALNSNILRSRELIANGEARLKEIESKIIANNARSAQIDSECAQVKQHQETYSCRLKEVTSVIRSYEQADAQNRDKMIGYIESLAEIRSSAGSLSAELQALRERKDELLAKNDELLAKKQDYLQQTTLLAQELSILEKQLESQVELCQTKSQAQKELTQKSHDCDNKIYSENANFSTLEANHRLLVSIKESYGGYIYAVKNLMSAAKDDAQVAARIKGVIADIIKTEQQHETAIETAIGGAMQNIVTDSIDDARYLIEYLKRTRGGTVTFLPVGSIKPRFENPSITRAVYEQGAVGLACELVKFDSYYKGVVSYLLGNTLICDNIANATEIAKKYSHAFKIVTLEGDIINPSGAVSGGSKKADTVSLLSNERKLEETAQKLALSRENLAFLQKTKQNLEQTKKVTAQELEELNQKQSVNAQSVVELKTKLDGKNSQLADAQREIENIHTTIDAINIRTQKIEKDQNAASQGKILAEREKDIATSELNKNKQEHMGLKEQEQQLVKQCDNLRLNLSTLEMEKTSLFGENARLESEKGQTQQLITNFEADIADKQQDIIKLKQAAEKAALNPQELEELNSTKNSVNSLNEQKRAILTKLAELDAKKDVLTQEITRLNDKKYAAELSLSKIDSDLDNLRERIWEEYQATYENSFNLKIENYDIVAGKGEIARLKKEISSLGNINYNAIEDFNKESERYEEMKVQREDLLKAHDDLQKILKDIKTEMQKQFDEGFTKINQNFNRAFKELFGGGRAQLQMDYTDCQDPLEAGVEIIAELPGKKLTNMTLLSGGEKTFTAIAILFSILSLRAMPFCVLDEVESALDDSNVERFAKYLSKFSQDTQFIIISHKKPTMEHADALFGVTMEEKGVSRLVSVKLADIENQLDIA